MAKNKMMIIDQKLNGPQKMTLLHYIRIKKTKKTKRNSSKPLEIKKNSEYYYGTEFNCGSPTTKLLLLNFIITKLF